MSEYEKGKFDAYNDTFNDTVSVGSRLSSRQYRRGYSDGLWLAKGSVTCD